MKKQKSLVKNTACKKVASNVGILAGVAGFEHGIFEVFQGNVRPQGNVINAIGPLQKFWEHGAEPAFTVIPNFLISGILTMIVGLTFIIWSAGFIQRKGGVWILVFLAILLFLFGGGFAPIVCAIIPIICAAKLNSAFPWLRRHIPQKVINFFTKQQSWSLYFYLFLAYLAIIVAIFGYPFIWFFNADTTLTILNNFSRFAFFIIAPIAVISAFAFDIQKQIEM